MNLQIDHITKRYKDKIAVNDVCLTLTPGVWGLLGANGAGKTTLMRMIAGIMKPTSGDILYDGIPISILKESYRDVFGYLPQDFGFYPEFTVKDYLEYMGALKGLTARQTKARLEELLPRLTLTDVYKKKIVKLSGGMKRRVGIAQALLNDPKILVLDEPTSGLDPGERVRFRNLLSEYALDRTVLISTHIVSDVEYIAGCIAIMKDGSLIETGTTEQLLEKAKGKVYCCTVPTNEAFLWESKLQVVNLRNDVGGKTELRYLADTPQTIDSVAVDPRLEDLFLYLFPKEGGAQ